MKTTACIFTTVLFASAQHTSAASPDSPSHDAAVAVTSTLVQVDAVVTDSHGRRVTDLAPEDFAVFEDGHRQKLTRFAYVQVSPRQIPPALQIPRADPSSTSVMAPAPAPKAQPPRESVGRTIVLLVDDLGMSSESMAFVRKKLREFVGEQMQPGDLVGVCRSSERSASLHQLSGDRRVLLSVIDGLSWKPNERSGLSYLDSQRELGRAGQSASVRAGVHGSLDLADDAINTDLSTAGTIAAINDVADALRELPGRKSIVLIRDGFRPSGAVVVPQLDGFGTPVDPAVNARVEMRETLMRLIDRMNRSGTVVYTMDTSKQETLEVDAEDDAEPMQLSSLASVSEEREFLNNIGEQSLTYLAAGTGGLAFDNSTDVNRGLARVLADQAGYYLLGYRSHETTLPNKNDASGLHHIQVKLTRAGLHIHSRCGYLGGPARADFPATNWSDEE
jgi:VWFA-related protein